MTEQSHHGEIIERAVVETPLGDLDALPGVTEAVQLYEAAMQQYTAAAEVYLPEIPEIVSSSGT